MCNPVMLIDPTGKGPEDRERRRERLFQRASKLDKKAFELDGSQQNRKLKLRERSSELRERARKIHVEPKTCPGSKPIANGGVGNNGNESGKKSESVESGSVTPPPALVKPVEMGLPTIAGSPIVGATLVQPQPSLVVMPSVQAFALYTMASPARIINIWGGSNANPALPDNSIANANVIINTFMFLGVPAGQLRIVPITNPPPAPVPNDGRQVWPTIWITP